MTVVPRLTFWEAEDLFCTHCCWFWWGAAWSL